jgi:FkbM family methyltransferase
MKVPSFESELNVEFILKKYAISKVQVVHIGAHQGQEAKVYDDFGFDSVLWVEALPDVAESTRVFLGNYPKQEIIQAVCWSQHGLVIPFHISKGDFSSSALQMKHHRIIWPGSAMTKTLHLESETVDRLSADLSKISLLNIDVQGAELQVLIGARDALAKTEFVFLEIAVKELYAGQALFQEINDFLVQSDFKLIDFEINPETGDGSALYGNPKELGEKVEFASEFFFTGFSLNKKELIKRWANYLRFRFTLLVRNIWRKLTGREIVPH